MSSRTLWLVVSHSCSSASCIRSDNTPEVCARNDGDEDDDDEAEEEDAAVGAVGATP
jgi:hypothetical protein